MSEKRSRGETRLRVAPPNRRRVLGRPPSARSETLIKKNRRSASTSVAHCFSRAFSTRSRAPAWRSARAPTFFLANFSARADSEHRGRDRIGGYSVGKKVSARRVLRYHQTDTGRRRSPSACSEEILKNRVFLISADVSSAAFDRYTVVAHTVMAYTLMVYIAMAYIVMTFVGMAYIVTTFVGMACVVMAYVGLAYGGMAEVVMAEVVMAYVGMAYVVMAAFDSSRFRRSSSADRRSAARVVLSAFSRLFVSSRAAPSSASFERPRSRASSSRALTFSSSRRTRSAHSLSLALVCSGDERGPRVGRSALIGFCGDARHCTSRGGERSSWSGSSAWYTWRATCGLALRARSFEEGPPPLTRGVASRLPPSTRPARSLSPTLARSDEAGCFFLREAEAGGVSMTVTGL